MCLTTWWSPVFAAVLAIGCSKPPASAAPAGSTNGGGEVAPAGGANQEHKVTCHLSCSGTEAKGYGATEEEARADVGRHIADNCKPADGQYFIFCDPPK